MDSGDVFIDGGDGFVEGPPALDLDSDRLDVREQGEGRYHTLPRFPSYDLRIVGVVGPSGDRDRDGDRGDEGGSPNIRTQSLRVGGRTDRRRVFNTEEDDRVWDETSEVRIVLSGTTEPQEMVVGQQRRPLVQDPSSDVPPCSTHQDRVQ